MGKETDYWSRVRAWERERKESDPEKKDKPYKASDMDSERMPFGCWLWIVIATIVVMFMIAEIKI